MAHYLDTSALVKLVVREAETDALRAWLRATDAPLVTSDLTRTELLRAVRRAAPEHAPAARAVLAGVAVLTLTAATFDLAGRIDPQELRSLDALHLTAALQLGDDLRSLVTYDARMAAAAAAHGLPVDAPGA